MSQDAFAVSTRRPLLSLSTLGLTAAASPITSDAKKKRKQNRNTGDAFNLCKKQVGQCLEIVAPDCVNEPECLAAVEDCCALLGKCDFGGSFHCFEAIDEARSLVGSRR